MRVDPVIRAARAGDVDVVLELMHELGYRNLDRASFVAAFASVAAHAEMRVMVAEDGAGRVVGVLALSHRPQLRLGGTLVTIDELIVASDARGRGVGRALLDAAKAVSVELGAARVELHTNRARENYARGFYPKNGFTEANSAVMRWSP